LTQRTKFTSRLPLTLAAACDFLSVNCATRSILMVILALIFMKIEHDDEQEDEDDFKPQLG